MSRYSLTQVSNGELLQSLHEKVALGRRGNAEVLALIAEVEKRKLYAEAGCPSMFAYCVEKLRFSEDEAYNRIDAARAARKFPIIFDLIADGRLHLTGARLLRRHLTPATANRLLRASIHKTRREIEQIIADHAPQPDLPTRVAALPPIASGPPAAAPGSQLVPERVGPVPEGVRAAANNGPEQVAARGLASAPAPRVAPLGAERYSLQLTMTKATRDKLTRAQELLGRQVAAGDVAEVLDRALDALIAQLEKRKFAATSKPRTTSAAKASTNPRHIPAHVKREVWKRDGARCTFIGDGGHQCEARRDLEFDHVEPVARGGEPTVANLRLRCRAHNQLEAERVLGYAFMNGRREAAAEARSARGAG